MSLTYRCQLQNRLITLTQELANSGEAKVWHTNFNGYLAKIYHNPHNERVDKLQLMVRNRPGDPNAHLNHISFAWPYSILEDNQGKVAGFLMPEVVGSETLLKLCTPKLRRQDKLEANWYFLHVVARNIAAIIQAIHAKGYVLGDIKLENILVNNRALPTIIDTDSFQVSDPYSGKIYRCLVGSEGFTPAELIGVNIADVDQTEVHDRFRLGVVIYYLLFSGPPFRGLWQGAGDSLEQSELIRRGLWPFSGDKLVVPSNTTIPLNILHRDLHALFLRCFNEGHKFPDRRPTAEEWRGTLEAALKEVIRCGKVDNHYYNRSYGKCYWCERSSDLNFDIFPGKSIANVTSTPSPKVAPTPLTNFTENLPKGITLEMVNLPAGKFLMGSPDSDLDAYNYEKPQHLVKVNSFAIGKYPITQAQYQAVMGTNPSQSKNNPQNPVEMVSWNDAQAFCQKLSQITGKTYRLPTEAEWEYACRAGTTTRFYFGDDANQSGNYAWYYGNSQNTTHPVGQKKPNAWGLYDMSGNVWEWCEDNWHDSYKNAPSDGSAWLTNDNDSHIIRGGSWLVIPRGCRSASRSDHDSLGDRYGFRVVCVPNVTSTQLPIATVTSTPSPKVSPPPPSSPPPPPAKLTPFTEKISKGITLEMVGLPAGQFLMGSPDSDRDGSDYEKPQHQVKVNSFAIGKYPVTQAQYEAVMGTNPSNLKNNPQNPVEMVRWNDAQAFCNKLSQITGKTYRLPTEAEWEYACRAGTTTRYYFGYDANQLGDYAWYNGNSQQTTHPVGQKKPNAWGLYDMSGNVWEWCEDNWHDNYIGAPKDGSAWFINNDNRSHPKCLRGGSWYDYPNLCRSAIRGRYNPDDYRNYVGFRVVCVPNVTSTQLPIATVTSTPLPKVAPPAPSSPPPPPAKLTPFTENLPNGLTLEMVGLPAGQFLMGSPDSDPDARDSEKPQHQVKVNSFAIGKYPVTQAQYEAVMGTNPSWFKNNPQNPVEKVRWNDAQAFCQKLSQITGKTYRLPTEAEWEYACRGGTTTRYYFGDDVSQLGDYAWHGGNSQNTTHPVGQKKPNAWGLHDMIGNVWEWCEDNWHDNYIGAPRDGSAWLIRDNDYQILRGGSWYFNPDYCRSAFRYSYVRRYDLNYSILGFRVVCVPNVTSTQLPIATVTSTPLPKVAPPAPSSPPPPPAKLTPFTENLPNGLTLEMVGLPAGQFLMGSPDSDRDAESWEKPQHQVKINSFAIGKYPVTQAQYQAVMGTNPSQFKNNPQNPVEKVSWDDAQAFCQKLSQITGKTYRLPTEAEWEYACRAGTTTRYYFGDDANQLEDYAWYEGNSQNTTHPVGQKKPNAWGLYDMSGNVWEWCEDNWHNSYQNAPRDGSAWVTNNSNVHIIRGGSWDDIPEYCRSTDRSNGDILNLSIGFRVVCVPSVTSTQLPIATVTSTPLPKVVPTPLTNFTENLPKGITLEMVGLPAGQFLMGSPDSDPDATSYEKPQHPVKINSFAIGKYPVTQAQYQAVMGTNPSHFSNNPQNPVERISSDDAQAFCQKLSQITGKTYRLPTEAEWEYACRAGTTTRYYFGDDANQLGDYAWYSGNSQNTTHPVGQKRPNAFGLYDMHGNVWEWCEDNWHNSYQNAPSDGSAWLIKDNDYQIVRGGSWYGLPNLCRSAYRNFNYRRGNIVNYFGFRVVCVPNVTSTQLPIATVTSTPLPKVVPTPLTNFTENLPKGITLEMVGLPAGQFLMGSPDSDRNARDFEKPQHPVKINSFAIGKYPVTQAQYQAVMGTNRSHFYNNPQNPVERISWNDAQAFCQKLSQITGKTYRLPTEAEWEYACRAGTTTRFYFGDDANQSGNYAWYYKNSQRTTHPVGQKRPNAWGLYDMSGNVWEWCEDDWHDNYIGAPKDGSAWLTNDNDYQILRGGSWYSVPSLCRSAYRLRYFRRDNLNDIFVGFRVVCGAGRTL